MASWKGYSPPSFEVNIGQMREFLRPGTMLQLYVPSQDERKQLVSIKITKLSGATFDTSAPAPAVSAVLNSEVFGVLILVHNEGVIRFRSPIVRIEPTFLRFGIPDADDIVRMQRREYARVASALDANCSVPPPPDSNFPPSVLKGARLYDISGGGCALVVQEPVEPGTLMNMTLELPEQGSVTVQAMVVRCEPSPSRRGVRYIIGAQFHQMDEHLRSKIIRYVFFLQRKITSGLSR